MMPPATVSRCAQLDLGKVTVVDKIGFSTDTGSVRFGQAAGYYGPFLR